MPDTIDKTWGHSINAIGVGGNCVWVMVTGGLQYSDIVLLELSEWHKVTTRSQTLVSTLGDAVFLPSTYHVLLVLLFSSDACMLHVKTCMMSTCTIWYVICCPSSALNTQGYWEVTDVREDRKIFPGYAKRFCQAFPAQVCVMLDYDALNERSCCD